MPEMIPLGWFHTIVAIIALISGVYSLVKFKFITITERSSQIYLICTIIAAITALMIFQRGTFGPGHALAILTLGAVVVGFVAANDMFFGKFSPYVATISFSATFLFHMIPAITDGLMRLPLGNPIVTDFKDPLLGGFYLAFLTIYILGVALQIKILRNR